MLEGASVSDSSNAISTDILVSVAMDDKYGGDGAYGGNAYALAGTGGTLGWVV